MLSYCKYAYHQCIVYGAGKYLAIAEADLFIRKLLAVDGLKVERQPDISFNDAVEGYEISNYIVAVE
jgi:hypothetical protein